MSHLLCNGFWIEPESGNTANVTYLRQSLSLETYLHQRLSLVAMPCLYLPLCILACVSVAFSEGSSTRGKRLVFAKTVEGRLNTAVNHSEPDTDVLGCVRRCEHHRCTGFSHRFQDGVGECSLSYNPGDLTVGEWDAYCTEDISSSYQWSLMFK